MILEKRKPGRPSKYNKAELMGIKVALDEYISRAEDPTLAEFIAGHEWSLTKEYLSDRKEFSDSVKKLILKQEAYLTSQLKNPTMAIFRLKQSIHGYSDKTEVETKNLHLHVQASETVSKDFTAFLKGKTTQSTSSKPS